MRHRIARTPGWLPDLDADLMNFVLSYQDRYETPGDLAEMGVYLGKSAILLGAHRHVDETFTVVDIFDTGGLSSANTAEVSREYSGLTRRAFESNYLRVHRDLPRIVEGESGTISRHAGQGTHRFVHVDASHLYENVVSDIETSRALLRPDGVVVFDDFRSTHTPGVAAAVWAAVRDGLVPFAVSDQKLYAAWEGRGELRSALAASAVGERRTSLERQEIAGHEVLRFSHRPSRVERLTPPALGPRIEAAHRAVWRLREPRRTR